MDKHGVDSGLYTLKWFFQCFLDRVPFELALRLWDIFLLDGDKVLTCGAYTILKIHFKPIVSRKSMDEVLWYLQSIIPNNFGSDCDKSIEIYLSCMQDLRRKKLDMAGDPSDDEFPKKPFGAIENIPKPVPVRREAPDEKVNKEIEAKRQQRAQLATDETDDFDNDEEDVEETSMMDKASASRISLAATSIASSSIADSPRNVQRPLSSIGRKREPPPVSPRKSAVASSTSPQSSSGRSYASMDSSISSVSIPHGGEAVRIHVPYNVNNDAPIHRSSSHAYHHHATDMTTASSLINNASGTSSSSRNGIDISRNKNDPNRIKIEISGSPSVP